MRHEGIVRPQFRLLYALKPTLTIARQTDHFSDSLGAGDRRIQVEHQHITLAVTTDHGDYPYEVIKRLLRIGTSIAADAFDLALDRLVFSNRSAALRPSRTVPSLQALQRAIVAGMRGAGVALRPGWTFSPHQTLFYRDGRPDQRRVEGFNWDVREFVLLCSHVGRTHHDILGRWPLRGSGQYSIF